MIGLIVFLVIIGVLLWLVSQIPMDPAILNIIRVVVIVCVVLYLVQAFGVFDYPLPRLHR
jgi:ABC-type siderophore export system fused ATPase/permease subunit